MKFSDRPPVRAGEDAVWDQAEAALWEAVRAAGLECTLNPGEGAFYGPKLEFVLRDAIGRDWQCGTLQVDFVLPERLDANYIGPDGAKHRPVMLHRAILGSLERFIGMLIEHYAGRLPVWLAPVQAVVATITNEADGYAHEVVERLKAAGVRAEADTRADKIGYKVREHSLRKVPLLLAVGGREQAERTVSLRRLGDTAQTALSLDAAVALCQREFGAARPVEAGRVTCWRYLDRAVAESRGGPIGANIGGSATHMATAAQQQEEHRINFRIDAREVRLIDAQGNMIGVVATRDALARAEEAGLDLVEIAPTATPPVCKILDYGKFKYEAQKKANAARKKQRVIEVKEIKMRPGIDDNDYNIKMRKVREFLDEGDKVKVTMRFRGREMAHQHLAMDILEKVKTEIADIAKVEQMPKLEGRQMIMVMAPIK